MSPTTTSTTKEVSEIGKKVTAIICSELAVDESKVKPEASFVDDLNADSLDIVELVMTMEEAFNLNIPDEDAGKMRTVGDAINYIKSRSVSS